MALFNNPLTNGFMKMEQLLRILPRGVVRAAESATQHLPRAVARKLLIQMAVRLRKPSS
jgi:hypothetical protein